MFPSEDIARALSGLEKRIERLERLDQVFTINAGETVINEAGIDRNLRIEGDNEPNLFFVDAGNDRVGIGTGAPGTVFHVFSSVLSAAFLLQHESASTNAAINIAAVRRTTTGLAANGIGGIWNFQIENDAGASINAARWFFQFTDVTAGAEGTRFQFRQVIAGVLRNILELDRPEIVFNEDSVDLNVRIESDGDPNNFFSDAGRDNIGMGTNTPNASAKLDITSTTGSLLIPRMTTAQRNALAAVNGMGIYNTTTNQFEKYEAGAWVAW